MRLLIHWDEFYSPYVYCHNDPIWFLDPDGQNEEFGPMNSFSDVFSWWISYTEEGKTFNLKFNNIASDIENQAENIKDNTCMAATIIKDNSDTGATLAASAGLCFYAAAIAFPEYAPPLVAAGSALIQTAGGLKITAAGADFVENITDNSDGIIDKELIARGVSVGLGSLVAPAAQQLQIPKELVQPISFIISTETEHSIMKN